MLVISDRCKSDLKKIVARHDLLNINLCKTTTDIFSLAATYENTYKEGETIVVFSREKGIFH